MYIVIYSRYGYGYVLDPNPLIPINPNGTNGVMKTSFVIKSMIHAILTSVIINQLLEKISFCYDLIVFFFVFYYFSHINITATHKIQTRYPVAIL